jgi:hypothetical protein
MFLTILMKASDQHWKEIIATNHLSMILRFAPKFENLCLGYKEMDLQNLQDVKSEYERRERRILS